MLSNIWSHCRDVSKGEFCGSCRYGSAICPLPANRMRKPGTHDVADLGLSSACRWKRLEPRLHAHPFYPICFSNFMGLTARWETKPQCYNLSQPNMIDKGSNGKTEFEVWIKLWNARHNACFAAHALVPGVRVFVTEHLRPHFSSRGVHRRSQE